MVPALETSPVLGSVHDLALLEGLVGQMGQPQRAAGRASAYKPPVEHPAELDDHSLFKFSTGFGISSGFAQWFAEPLYF